MQLTLQTEKEKYLNTYGVSPSLPAISQRFQVEFQVSRRGTFQSEI